MRCGRVVAVALQLGEEGNTVLRRPTEGMRPYVFNHSADDRPAITRSRRDNRIEWNLAEGNPTFLWRPAEYFLALNANQALTIRRESKESLRTDRG